MRRWVIRGYFGIGVECMSKLMNLGLFFCMVNVFGVSFVFIVGVYYIIKESGFFDMLDVVCNVFYF